MKLSFIALSRSGLGLRFETATYRHFHDSDGLVPTILSQADTLPDPRARVAMRAQVSTARVNPAASRRQPRGKRGGEW